jgi:hypothetical protein
MKAFLRFCYNTSLGFWLGATIFFLFVLLKLFAVLPGQAGRAASVMFPIYYETGTYCAIVALLASLFLALSGWTRSRRKRLAPILLVVALAGVNYYAGWVVLPQAKAAQVKIVENKGSEAEIAQARERFQRLHRLSTQLFGTVIFLLAVALIVSLMALRF